MTATLPSLVILGRPNVGKSTLFNRLTGTRRAIVTNEPGITRDRIYGTATWCGRAFQVVDTGGIIPDDKALLAREILRQARVAIDTAAQLVLVVDARAGVTPLDAELARLLHSTGKPLAIAANKVDTPEQASLAAGFYRLADDVYPVSAEHGLGVDDLLDALTRDFPSAEEPAPHVTIDVAIIGRPNVGKSTLLNRLAGEERVIVSADPGTTRDAVDTLLQRGEKTYRLIDTAGIRRKGKTKLVAEKLSVVMARRHLERADVVLVLVDAAQGVTSNDATIASYAQQSGRSVIVVMNKWDLALQLARENAQRAGSSRPVPTKSVGIEVRLSARKGRLGGRSGIYPQPPAGGRSTSDMKRPEKEGVEFIPSPPPVLIPPLRDEGRRAEGTPEATFDPAVLLRDYESLVRRKLKFLDYAPVIFLSGLTGERVEKLFTLIDCVADARRRRIPTSELNQWLAGVDLDRGTSPAARRVKIYYITQATAAPPTFVLFTNQTRPLHFSYERFLENQLRARFDFLGTPIFFRQRLKKR
jgi:ribosome-associated GTPase EngA